MNPEAAVEKQIARYRQMTGEERLKIALDLHEFSCDVAREAIRRQFPDADEAEVDRRFTGRIRGMMYKRSDGRTVLPSLVVIDWTSTRVQRVGFRWERGRSSAIMTQSAGSRQH